MPAITPVTIPAPAITAPSLRMRVSRFDGVDPIDTAGESEGNLAGPAPEVENRAVMRRHQRQQRIEEFSGIWRPRMVALGDRAVSELRGVRRAQMIGLRLHACGLETASTFFMK